MTPYAPNLTTVSLGTLEPTALGSPAVSGFTPFVVNLQHQQPGSNNLARTPRLQPPLRKRRHSGSSLAPKPVKLPKAEKSGQGPMAASRMSSGPSHSLKPIPHHAYVSPRDKRTR